MVVEYLSMGPCEKCNESKEIIENIIPKGTEPYGLRVCVDCYNEFHKKIWESVIKE